MYVTYLDLSLSILLISIFLRPILVFIDVSKCYGGCLIKHYIFLVISAYKLYNILARTKSRNSVFYKSNLELSKKRVYRLLLIT